MELSLLTIWMLLQMVTQENWLDGPKVGMTEYISNPDALSFVVILHTRKKSQT